MLSVIVLDTLFEDEINISTIMKEAYARRDLHVSPIGKLDKGSLRKC